MWIIGQDVRVTASTLHVRAADGDDFLAAARVRARSWRVAYEGLVPRSYLDAMADESSLRAWAQRASTSGVSRHHVAVLDSVVVGFTVSGNEPATDVLTTSGRYLHCTPTRACGVSAWDARSCRPHWAISEPITTDTPACGSW